MIVANPYLVTCMLSLANLEMTSVASTRFLRVVDIRWTEESCSAEERLLKSRLSLIDESLTTGGFPSLPLLAPPLGLGGMPSTIG